MSRIYIGEYCRTVTDNHYITLPARWSVPETVYYAFMEVESGIRFLCCSDSKDALSTVNDDEKILARGNLVIVRENKLRLPDEFLQYMKIRKQGQHIICYGNMDRFEIWIPEELEYMENTMDTQDIEKELQELGLF
ncbi:MAG: hypothetical protein LUG93_14845 [Lachnospiraceae bacterium]|nr:hypothetical protein [Lachnospiraceae bacterium]